MRALLRQQLNHCPRQTLYMPCGLVSVGSLRTGLHAGAVCGERRYIVQYRDCVRLECEVSASACGTHTVRGGVRQRRERAEPASTAADSTSAMHCSVSVSQSARNSTGKVPTRAVPDHPRSKKLD